MELIDKVIWIYFMHCLLEVKVKLLMGFSNPLHHEHVWGNRGIAAFILAPFGGEWSVSCAGYFTVRE
jgi:hypothetical protein